MKIFYIFFISLFLLIQAGLQSKAQKSVFDMKLAIDQKLPCLVVDIREEGLAKAYLSKHVLTSEEIADNGIEEQYYSSVFYEDHKINDAKHLFERYLFNYLMEQGQQKHGYVDMNVLYYNWDERLGASFGLGVVTMGFVYLLGLPYFSFITRVEVEMKIYDMNDNLIAAYYGTGKNRYRESLYFHRKNQRESNLAALKDAIFIIDQQVKNDFQKLQDSLLLTCVK